MARGPHLAVALGAGACAGLCLTLSACELAAPWHAEQAAPAAEARPPARAPSPGAPARAAAPADRGEAREPDAETVILLGGDVLTSEALRDAMEATGDPAAAFAALLAPAARHFHADPGSFVVLNLESPVAAERRNPLFEEAPGGSRLVPVRLLMPGWVLEGLREAGVDAVSLANNHALDQERQGLAETLEAARKVGLVTLGAGFHPHFLWPAVVGDEGARVAVYALYDGRRSHGAPSAGETGLAHLGPDALDAIRRAAAEHDAVIVTVHVLGELRDTPKARWRRWAQELAEAGADVIAVHGTHVVMAVESLRVGERTVPLAWGLGNFVSDMAPRATPRRSAEAGGPKAERPEAREALLMRVRVRAGGAIAVDYLPLWMSDDRFVLYHTRAEAPVRFALLPLSACGRATALPASWPPALAREVGAWIDRRRDHVLEVSGLWTRRCAAGVPAWLSADP